LVHASADPGAARAARVKRPVVVGPYVAEKERLKKRGIG